MVFLARRPRFRTTLFPAVSSNFSSSLLSSDVSRISVEEIFSLSLSLHSLSLLLSVPSAISFNAIFGNDHDCLGIRKYLEFWQIRNFTFLFSCAFHIWCLRRLINFRLRTRSENYKERDMMFISLALPNVESNLLALRCIRQTCLYENRFLTHFAACIYV